MKARALSIGFIVQDDCARGKHLIPAHPVSSSFGIMCPCLSISCNPMPSVTRSAGENGGYLNGVATLKRHIVRAWPSIMDSIINASMGRSFCGCALPLSFSHSAQPSKILTPPARLLIRSFSISLPLPSLQTNCTVTPFRLWTLAGQLPVFDSFPPWLIGMLM